jgi:hypothetical protein
MGMQRIAIYVIWFLLATCGAIRALGAVAAAAWVAEDQVFYKIFVRSFADLENHGLRFSPRQVAH